MVELQPSKLVVRVRFPSPALHFGLSNDHASRPVGVAYGHNGLLALAFGGTKDERKPDVFPVATAYLVAMADGSERTLGEYASVTVEAAARLVDVDVATIEHWSDVGSIEIERRGDMHVVRLDRVKQLTDSSRAGSKTRFGSLKALLRDAEPIESPSVVGLQELVREKAGDTS